MTATRRRAGWLLLIAMLLGSVGAIGFCNRILTYEESLGEMVTVWTTTAEIPPYAEITRAMLQPTSAPKRYIPTGAVLDEAAITSQVARVPLQPGDLITSAVLQPPDLGGNRSITLTDRGQNSILIDATIQTGDRVDILVAYREQNEDVARYLLTSVPVLSFTDKGERTISLLVSPEAARELVWMETFGRQIRIVRQG